MEPRPGGTTMHSHAVHLSRSITRTALWVGLLLAVLVLLIVLS
ncbi:hypothetical protein [Tsukamurella sp. 8J]|nr:hypothetical protein [Tsukamurella sp. 8J]MDF0532578.1 hypothetical protein [Tsukamurella sp. 8J]